MGLLLIWVLTGCAASENMDLRDWFTPVRTLYIDFDIESSEGCGGGALVGGGIPQEVGIKKTGFAAE